MLSPYIPPATVKKIIDLGISEADVMDVFNNGKYGQTNSGAKIAVKKYNGYEIGLMYVQNSNNGAYVITTVWKRDRR